MKKTLKLIGLLLGMAGAALGQGCNCQVDTSITNSYKAADVVALGTAIKKEMVTVLDPSSGFKYYRMKWTLTLSEAYKGKVKRQIFVTTAVKRSECGFGFEAGKEYLVYASFRKKYYNNGPKVDKFLYTDICSRTKPKDAAEVDRLTAIHTPTTFEMEFE